MNILFLGDIVGKPGRDVVGAELGRLRDRLKTDGHRFGSLVGVIVTSPQFLNKRGRDDPRE